jgi:hypothetical protein
MLMVSLAADARAATPRTERKEEICILEAKKQEESCSYLVYDRPHKGVVVCPTIACR